MKKCSFEATPKMKKRIQPMQIPAKFFLFPLMIVFLLLMCMPCMLIFITFSMSMLSFIEDNKRNEHGGEFSRKLRIFQNFCISSFSMLCMI